MGEKNTFKRWENAEIEEIVVYVDTIHLILM